MHITLMTRAAQAGNEVLPALALLPHDIRSLAPDPGTLLEHDAGDVVMVDDIDATLASIRELGAELVDEVVRYEDAYRLCYVRGPEGILVGLAEPLTDQD